LCFLFLFLFFNYYLNEEIRNIKGNINNVGFFLHFDQMSIKYNSITAI